MNNPVLGGGVGTAKRPGRPWGPARGSCKEINDLVSVLRTWLDVSNVTVAQLHASLTPDHFTDGYVPELRQLREQLSGVALTWDLVEAVADVCHPEETGSQAVDRLVALQPLWAAALATPTPLTSDGHPSVPAHELVEAQRRTISALEELDRVRQAFAASEQARQQSLQVATVLFSLLGQAQAQVAQLTRQLDALLTAKELRPADLERAEFRLERTHQQKEELRTQLARAEGERDRAQKVADQAARRIQELEDQLRELRVGVKTEEAMVAAGLDVPGPLSSGSTDYAADQVDAVLQKARDVLDREHEAVQEAAEEVGWGRGSQDVVIIPGQVVKTTDPDDAVPSSGLFGITQNNPQTSDESGSEILPRTAADSIRYVGAATRQIARGLDLDEIVLGLCRATVPAYADAILVYIRVPLPVGDEPPAMPFVLRLSRIEGGVDGEDATLDPDLNPTSVAELCELHPGPLANVLRDVRPVFGDSVPARSALVELLGSEHPLPPGHRAILAPLRGRRRVIGATVFLRRAERPAFEPNDLLVANQLTTHTALSLEKAALYNRDTPRLSVAVQHRMLPRSLAQPPGIRLASRYVPAGESARVGGDWYDAIPLSGSRVALAVGDVMGHSMTAGASMGQLRSATLALGRLDLPPHEVLMLLSEQAEQLDSEIMATCLYAVYDPVSYRITIANAGHPPPVLLHPDGRTDLLQVPPGAPIGVGGVAFETVEFDAPAGATLLLYTDGLVESRLLDVWTGIERLRQRLSSTAQHMHGEEPRLEALCDDVAQLPGPGNLDDDIVLLAAHLEGIPPGDVRHWFLEPEDKAPGRARRLARRALAEWGLDGLTESAMVAVSELVTNAVRYAERPIALRFMKTDVLHCEVEDDSPDMPQLRHALDPIDRSRGLQVVGHLTSRWGTRRKVGGKIVWFEMPL